MAEDNQLRKDGLALPKAKPSNFYASFFVALPEIADQNYSRTSETRQDQETTDNDHAYSLMTQAGLPLP